MPDLAALERAVEAAWAVVYSRFSWSQIDEFSILIAAVVALEEAKCVEQEPIVLDLAGLEDAVKEARKAVSGIARFPSDVYDSHLRLTAFERAVVALERARHEQDLVTFQREVEEEWEDGPPGVAEEESRG